VNVDSDAHCLIEKANAAFRQVSKKVLLRAKLTGTPIVIWEDGQVKEIPPEEIERRIQKTGENTEIT
jgi:hypothetical protein